MTPPPETNAGAVSPGIQLYVVTDAHKSETLETGDMVVMVVDPKTWNWLLRPSDMTLHKLKDEHGQYLHLKPLY